MTDIHYFVPATSYAEADAIADGVHAGRLTHVSHYTDAAAAQRICDHFERLGCTPRHVYVIGRSNPEPEPVWSFDKAGEVAAVLTLFAMVALVGVASLFEVFA